ncbi:MAG: hypothetical protein IPK52_05315 [Chloroflexi bacterium]|nr:hypothetical protein [Chloroflexota bacterium]
MSGVREQIIILLVEAANAHHRAFEAVGGNDPEWPMWYAHYCLERLNGVLQAKLTESTLVWLLVQADRAFRSQRPDMQWQAYYADAILTEVSA